MSARVEPDVSGPPATGAALVQAGALSGAAVVPFDPDDRYAVSTLPNDHPKWMKDTLSISQRSRELLSKLKPVALRVITYWEHRVRSIAIAGRTLSVDPSGSYRLD